MKKLLVAIFISVAFLGCGGGGESNIEDIPIELTLGEATTANAFKAYDVLSVATFLPSFVTKLRHVIANDGVDKITNCNVSGSINVSYEYPNTSNGIIPTYGVNFEDIVGVYYFDKCMINVSGNDIYLDGELQNVRYKFDKNLHQFQVSIKDGFVFKQSNPNEQSDLTYRDTEGGRQANFFSLNGDNHGLVFSIETRFFEKVLEDVYCEVIVGDNRDGYYTDVPEGIYYGYFDENDSIQFNNDEFFYFTGPKYNLELQLKGSDNKIVKVWQDDSETVFAETENTFDTSFTSYTPSF